MLFRKQFLFSEPLVFWERLRDSDIPRNQIVFNLNGFHSVLRFSSNLLCGCTRPKINFIKGDRSIATAANNLLSLTNSITITITNSIAKKVFTCNLKESWRSWQSREEEWKPDSSWRLYRPSPGKAIHQTLCRKCQTPGGSTF